MQMVTILIVVFLIVAVVGVMMMRVGVFVGRGIEPGARIRLGVGRSSPSARNSPISKAGLSMRVIAAAGLSRRSLAVSAASVSATRA